MRFTRRGRERIGEAQSHELFTFSVHCSLQHRGRIPAGNYELWGELIILGNIYAFHKQSLSPQAENGTAGTWGTRLDKSPSATMG